MQDNLGFMSAGEVVGAGREGAGDLTHDSAQPPYGIVGGQTTISPPLKVNFVDSDSIACLESGIDTFYLSIDVDWSDCPVFSYFSHLKETAIQADSPSVGFLRTSDIDNDWPFLMLSYGRKGYEWILESNEFTLHIGGWEKPKERPSMKVEIGSETLWHLGVHKAIGKVYDIIQKAGGKIVEAKASRVDVCLDILCPESLWHSDLRLCAVTRASYITPHFDNHHLTGISIGKGHISATLYDKPKEIKQKSAKFWMFDLWGIEVVPENHKVVRIEFKLRREAIKKLGLNTPEDVIYSLPNLWAYCSQTWLKFQTNPGAHHTQRKNHKWWSQVQDGFKGAQGAEPLVRAAAIKAEEKHLMAQIYGLATSLAALRQEKYDFPIGTQANHHDVVEMVFENSEFIDSEEKNFTKDVELKRVKVCRMRQKEEEAKIYRLDRSFPTGN